MSDFLERLGAALADRYTIEREIGSGGMATVYLAEDLRHHRQVAIKVLRPDLAATLGPGRFLREIDVAAKLQHPHILPLHESGEADGFLFYVMPYVEGSSLRERLTKEGELPIADAIRILRDVVDALTEAHAHGVVHRDIKPANILLRGRHALVTDFGVAKAVSEATGREQLTTAGMALGTPAYMAPEQASADPHLDHRVDIYAVGAMAYELLTGRPVFMGTTPQMVLSAHVNETPQPVSTYRKSVPAALEAVVMRCLAKKPADRFQSADELLQQLEMLATPSGALTPAGIQPVPAASGLRQWLGPGILALAAIVVVVVGVLSRLGPAPIAITTSNVTQVTRDPGLEFQPAISPGGSEVAYVRVDAGPVGRVLVRSTIDVGSGGETNPGEGVPGRHLYPSWTPDGASVRFWACAPGAGCDWKETGKLGGAVRSVYAPGVVSLSAWSRDGTRIAFVVGDSIFVQSADGGEPELLGVHTVSPWVLHSLAWSPDGRWIAYVNGNARWRTSANKANSSIWIIAAAGGEPVAITDETSLNVSPQWLPDSRHLLFVSDRDGARSIHVVEVASEGTQGPSRSVPGPSDPHSISISADGRKLVLAKFTALQNIWSISIPESGIVSIRDATPVTRENQTVEQHDLSDDGEWIVYDSDLQGEFDIYRRRLDGGQAERVADVDGNAFEPDFSPDGREVAFYGGGPRSRTEVWVVQVDGGTPQPITDFPGFDQSPTWSPDGNSIAYGSEGPEPGGSLQRMNIWMLSREAGGMPWGEPVQLTDFGCGPRPEWAPDGRSIVCSTGLGLARVSTAGEVLDRFPMPAGFAVVAAPRISVDGSRIFFIAASEAGERGLWAMAVTGGDPTQLVRFDEPSLFLGPMNALTVDAERLYITIAEYESDIWVMDLEW